MEHLFEVPAPSQPVATLDSINSTAAIWTGQKKYSWLKSANPKSLDSFQQTSTVDALLNDASPEDLLKENNKKRKKTDTPSKKKTKTPTKNDNEQTNTTQSDTQSKKKVKTNTPKQKTPKKGATKVTSDIPTTFEEIPPPTEPEVIEQSVGPALQIEEGTPHKPTKKRRTKTSEKAQSEITEPKVPATYECPVESCGKIFDRKGTLNRHMASHSEKRNFKCDVCDKAFKLKGELVRHYQAHTSKQFQCAHPGCDKKFSFECNLERHVLTVHMGVKNFECPHCKKEFAQPTDLERHLLVHSGERPYACRWCDNKFKQLGHLQSHEKRKHDPTKVTERDLLQSVVQDENSPHTPPKQPELSDSEEEEDSSESYESEIEVTPAKESAKTPTRRSTRTAAKNAIYNFDFSDSESEDSKSECE